MKLNRKNKSKFNNSIKRPTSNNKKNLNLIPLFIQITKKNMIHSQNKEDESSLNPKKKNLNINNSSNNNNMHSSSSLYINFMSPINNINKNINNINRSKKELLNNESLKNKMILTSVDNSSVIASKEKILSYNQNNKQKKKNIQIHHKKQDSINNIILSGVGGIGIKKKNSKNKKYPLTSLNSRKNSVDKKKSNKSSLQKYQQLYNKNSNRNKNFQNTNINTCSNKNLLSNNNNNSNNKVFGFSSFNKYMINTKIQKNSNKKNNKISCQNISHYLYNNIKKYPGKNIINITKSIKNASNTAKVSPRTSFININSKSLKAINLNKNTKEENKDINVKKNKSKINELINNNNIGRANKKIIDINKNIIISKNKNKNSNNFNNFYNNFVSSNNSNINNVNNNNNNCCNNFENILNNCQTTSGALYNNYNININNQINNHIIYNNSNSRKKINNINFVNNKINRIISQSQQEILQFKKNIKKHFTSNNSPNKIFNYKIISCKKIKPNNHNSNYKNNNIFFLFNNLNNEYSNKNSKNKLKNKNNIYKKKTKKYKGLRNQEKNKKNSKIKSKSTEKLNMQFQIKSLKNELINDNNNDMTNFSKINDNKIKSCGKLDLHNNGINEKVNKENETIKKNKYMEDSLKLTKYITDYYKKNHSYPATNIDFYKYGRLIGQGAFGKVNLGLNVLTGRVVAIKSFNKKNLDSPNNENMKKIIYETNLMRKLNHPNITKILEMFEDEKYILIIMEYINGGNLFSFVKKRRKLTEKISKFLFKQIILGIKHIHSQNIVHRDVKLENILIDLNNTIKICDFGIGRILSSPDEFIHDQCGTPMYMAPEILSCSKEIGYKGFPVDIWSAGIALYIMLSGSLPFSVKNENDSLIEGNNNKKKNMALRKAIINSEPKKIEKISDEARDLLHGLLNKDPNKRLTCDEILKHPWLNSEDPNNKNNKHHLFTKAEMIMLSRTYIDYRKANMEELQENFTISNLKRDKDMNNNDKNITTKSFILTPYNSLIGGEDDSIEDEEKYLDSEFDDFNNGNINLENELISFSNKVKEFNMLYELNNNNEVDNGMLINTKINTHSSWSITNGIINNHSVIKTESVFYVEEDGNKEDYDYDEPGNGFKKKLLIEKKQVKSRDNEDENNDNRIFDKIEVLGYDKKYVKECLENNSLCHATSIYFLLKNYDKI